MNPASFPLVRRHMDAFWCMEGDPKIACWLGLGIYRALQRTLFMTNTGVPPAQGQIHEQGSVLHSIYQVFSLLLLAAVIAFKRQSYPCRVRGMSRGGGLCMAGYSRWRCGTVAWPWQGHDNTDPCLAASRLADGAAQAWWSGLVYPFSRTHRLV